MGWKANRGVPAGSLATKPSRQETPTLVYEVESEFLAGARLSVSPAGVRRFAMAGLGPGHLQVSATEMNIRSSEEVDRSAGKLRRVLGKGGRWGLLIPDAVARLSVLHFETLPAKAAEVDALLRWRIRETLGFPPGQARLSYQITQREAGGVELLVVAVKDDVLRQYEATLEPYQRDSASLILPVTLPLLALLPESQPGAQLLTHVYSGCVTHAVVEGSRLRLWRSRPPLQREPGFELEEILSEAARAAASARDRLGIQIERAWCCVRAATDGSNLSQGLSSILGMPVECLSLGAQAGAMLSTEEKEGFQPLGAPLAAIIVNSGAMV